MKAFREKMGLDGTDQGKRSFKKFTNVEVPQQHLNQWNFQMLPRLRKLLEKVLKDSAESCSVTLMMAGERVEDAKTTICVTCASAKKVRAALKKYYVLDDDAWDLVVLRGDIQRSKVPRKKRRRPAKARPGREEAPAFGQFDVNPCYQERPLCGASIGAFRNEEHLPPVSYGGAILVDGMPYGMTVHHMLETPSDGEEDEEQEPEGQAADAPLRSSGNWASDPMHSNADVMYTWCDEDPSELNLEFQISDDEEGDGFSLSEGFDSGFDDYLLSESYSSDEEDAYEDEDAASIGDTAGVEPGEEPRLFITQPAIDDVHEGFFPSPEDRDDEHLASHALGYVHASSGVRRWTRRGIKHEIDWALIKINDGRTDARNIVFDRPASRGPPGQQRRRRGEQGATHGELIYLNDVARIEDLGGLQVHCCGRTSGLQTGQISRAMTLVKLHGRQSFSTSFCVDGNFGGTSPPAPSKSNLNSNANRLRLQSLATLEHGFSRKQPVACAATCWRGRKKATRPTSPLWKSCSKISPVLFTPLSLRSRAVPTNPSLTPSRSLGQRNPPVPAIAPHSESPSSSPLTSED